MHSTPISLSHLILILFAACPLVAAQDDETATASKPKLDHSMQRVVVFKDGYCLVVKEAVGTTDDEGNIYSDDVPDAAVLGSFWTIPEQGKLQSMVAGWIEDEETKDVTYTASEIIQLVEANIGAEATVTLDDKTIMGGRLKKVLGQTIKDKLSSFSGRVIEDPFSSQGATAAGSIIIPRMVASFFLLSTSGGDVAINASNVRLLSISDMKTELTHKATRKQRKKQLRFHFDEPNQEVKLNIMYFRPGVRWIPTYRVDLADEKKTDGKTKIAGLTLQGEIINEAEDFHDVPVDIVVGVPNFRFRNVASPLVLESVLRNALAQSAPQVMSQVNNGQMMMNNFSNSVQVRGGNFEAPTATSPHIPTELTTKAGNDLFVYTLPKMNLRKGDRASVPILTADVPYRDVYTWEATVKHTETISEMANNDSPLRIANNKVWRQIELLNTSEIPWTTGAAMLVDGFQPLAQELLTYTPSGGKCRVPVTIAVDVRAQAKDEERKRVLDAMRFDNRSYAKVSGRITSRIVNYKDEPVDIEVAVRFGGKGDSASGSGEMVSTHFQSSDWHNYRGDQAVNSSTRATWSSKIEAGKTFEPTVDYHFYTRR